MRETVIAAVVAVFVLVATQAWMDRRERLRRKADAAEADRREFTEVAEEAMVVLHEFQRQALDALRIADAIAYRGGTFTGSASRALREDLDVAVGRARVAQAAVDGMRERMRLYRPDDHPVPQLFERALINCRRLVQKAESIGGPIDVEDSAGALMSDVAVATMRHTEPHVDHVLEAQNEVVDPNRRDFAGVVRRERDVLRTAVEGSRRPVSHRAHDRIWWHTSRPRLWWKNRQRRKATARERAGTNGPTANRPGGNS
jgi:hypothetical protein